MSSISLERWNASSVRSFQRREHLFGSCRVQHCTSARNTAIKRTENFPLATWLVCVHVDGRSVRRQIDLGAVVRPRTELHRTVLVVKRKPLYVDRAGGDEQSYWNPRHFAGAVDHRVGRKLAVDVLIGTVTPTFKYSTSMFH